MAAPEIVKNDDVIFSATFVTPASYFWTHTVKLDRFNDEIGPTWHVYIALVGKYSIQSHEIWYETVL